MIDEQSDRRNHDKQHSNKDKNRNKTTKKKSSTIFDSNVDEIQKSQSINQINQSYSAVEYFPMMSRTHFHPHNKSQSLGKSYSY